MLNRKKRLSNNTPENDMQYILKIVMKNTNRAKWWDVRSKIRLQRHSSYHFSPLLSLSLKEARYHVMSSYLETHKSQGQSTASEDPESATMGSSSHPLFRWQQSWLVPWCWPCPEEALNQWHLAKCIQILACSMYTNLQHYCCLRPVHFGHLLPNDR